MDVAFYKMHVFGNDLVLINTISQDFFSKQLDYSAIAAKICSRHTGIGANGVVFLKKGIDFPASSVFYNAAGEESFANDILFCLARYLFDTGIYGKNDINIENGADIYTVDIIDSNNFKINLGEPVINGKKTDPVENLDLFSSVEIESKKLFTLPVSTGGGKKGKYFYAPEMCRSELKKTAKTIYSTQPKSEYEQSAFVLPINMQNTEFFSWFPRDNVDISSAAAIAYVGAVIQGVAGSEITMIHNEYEFFMHWMSNGKGIQLTGSSAYVYTGTWYIE